MTVLFEPAHLPVVRDIAPHQVACPAVPGRTFRPEQAGVYALNRGIADLVFCEALIDDDDVFVRIARRIVTGIVAWGLRLQSRTRQRRPEKGTPADLIGLHVQPILSQICWTEMSFNVPFTTWTLSPRGAHMAGSVGPKIATTGTPVAAARCVIPESFPMKTRAPAIQQASYHRSGIRVAPSRGFFRSRTPTNGKREASRQFAVSFQRPILTGLPENG